MPFVRTYVVVVHRVVDAVDTYAAHAAALARTRSMPAAFNGDEAGRKTSGDAPDTFEAAGKATARESGTLTLSNEVALHGSVAFAAAGPHAPAVTAVVDGAVVQRHAVHPAVGATASEQQQPPRHEPVVQSNGDAHASPGLTVRHAPLNGAQAEQPSSADELEQQMPPRQAADAHAALLKQVEPGDAAAAPAVVIDEERMHVEMDDAPRKAVVKFVGHAVGVVELTGQ